MESRDRWEAKITHHRARRVRRDKEREGPGRRPRRGVLIEEAEATDQRIPPGRIPIPIPFSAGSAASMVSRREGFIDLTSSPSSHPWALRAPWCKSCPARTPTGPVSRGQSGRSAEAAMSRGECGCLLGRGSPDDHLTVAVNDEQRRFSVSHVAYLHELSSGPPVPLRHVSGFPGRGLLRGLRRHRARAP
jgi:hypothetical protein